MPLNYKNASSSLAGLIQNSETASSVFHKTIRNANIKQCGVKFGILLIMRKFNRFNKTCFCTAVLNRHTLYSFATKLKEAVFDSLAVPTDGIRLTGVGMHNGVRAEPTEKYFENIRSSAFFCRNVYG